ncbi:MAG: helix-turn-helix domain-containing protein [Pseudomonadota bacterium]
MGDLETSSAHFRDCGDCPIRQRAVCSYSSPRELTLLDAAKSYRTYATGEEIVAEGMPASLVGSVVTGAVALHESLADGRRQMVGLLLPSDFVGRPLRPIAQYAATAASDVKLCLFERGKFERLLQENRSLERRLLEMTLDELDAARHWHMVLGRKTAREKIASFLVLLAVRMAPEAMTRWPNRVALEIPLSREAIGDFLGLTIETVSRNFTGLRKSGVITMTGARNGEVLDMGRLREEAGDDGSDDGLDGILRA